MTHCISWANWKLPGSLQYCCADSANTLRVYRVLQERFFDWTLSMGDTTVQAGRLRVRFPMVSLEFFIYIFLAFALWPIVRLSLSWDCGWESLRGRGCFFLWVLYYQLEVSVSDRSLVLRSAVECEVFECDSEALIMGWPWPTRNSCAMIGGGGGGGEFYTKIFLFFSTSFSPNF